MPTYEYRCAECKKEYEVFHKVKEVEEDVICPVCHSASHMRLMSVTGVSMKSYSSSFASSGNDSPADTCSSGNCCGGSCNLN